MIGIFFGSDTGNTKKVAFYIQKIIGKKKSKVFDISKCKKNDLENYKYLILGIPTWFYGEPQSDWENFLKVFKKIKFSEKKVAIFGCGDQEDYPEYFCDAMKILFNIIKKSGGLIFGEWPSKGYNFLSSKSLIKKNKFLGLVIDEDRQSSLTKIRVKKWIKQITVEMKL
ncbi:MAG: flavodoxin FldA [Enterobacteriaceae bacterium]